MDWDEDFDLLRPKAGSPDALKHRFENNSDEIKGLR